ncbi:MAG: hypothetical protein KJ548_01150 [Actinobacteria bacterium]|nr:hypothetical protein [Actinomycetota bacterium]MCG2797991.1 hypothetical protein [Cellulomonas sp.]
MVLVLAVSLTAAGCGGRSASQSPSTGGALAASTAPIAVPSASATSAGDSSPALVVQQDDLDALTGALDDDKTLEAEVNDEMSADSP